MKKLLCAVPRMLEVCANLNGEESVTSYNSTTTLMLNYSEVTNSHKSFIYKEKDLIYASILLRNLR